MQKKSLGIGIIRKQTLNATVIRACTCCGAPGFYHDVPDVNAGCFDPARKGQPVGPVCPNCGEDRPANEDRGEIWCKEWTIWGLLWDQIKCVFRRKRHGRSIHGSLR